MQISSGGITRQRVLDVTEDLGLLYAGQPAGSGSMGDPRPIYQVGTDGLNIAALYTREGSAPPSFITRNGHGVRIFAPGTAQISTAAMLYSFPLGRNLSQIPSTMRRQFRFVWETVLERSTPLIASAFLEIGMKDDPAVGIATANGGLVLSSISTENAGRWTLKYKLTNGGGLQPLVDTGVAPAIGTLHHIKFEYFDRFPDPRLNIYINGALVASLAGATLPAFDGNEPLNPCIVGSSPAIGQQDFQYTTRFYIEEI